jgi:hypothetical protein
MRTWERADSDIGDLDRTPTAQSPVTTQQATSIDLRINLKAATCWRLRAAWRQSASLTLLARADEVIE